MSSLQQTCTFVCVCVSFSGVLNLALDLSQVKSIFQLLYRVFAPMISLTLVIFPITIVSTGGQAYSLG